MILQVLFRIVLALTSTRDAEALAFTAPERIELEVARVHVAAATVAGGAYHLSPELLLSIAAHESRYAHDTITPESGGRVSCGVMTPTPVTSCSTVPTVLGGYLAGASHLDDWRRATGSTREMLLGYAGGWRLINACRAGPVRVARAGGELDLCNTGSVFNARAMWIVRERARRGPTS